MSSRRRRSTRSYVVELVVAAIVIVVIFGWVNFGGASAFGQWFAELIGTP